MRARCLQLHRSVSGVDFSFEALVLHCFCVLQGPGRMCLPPTPHPSRLAGTQPLVTMLQDAGSNLCFSSPAGLLDERLLRRMEFYRQLRGTTEGPNQQRACNNGHLWSLSMFFSPFQHGSYTWSTCPSEAPSSPMMLSSLSDSLKHTTAGKLLLLESLTFVVLAYARGSSGYIQGTPFPTIACSLLCPSSTSVSFCFLNTGFSSSPVTSFILRKVSIGQGLSRWPL